MPGLPAYHPTYPRLLHVMLRAAGHDADAALRQAGLTPESLQADPGAVDAAHMAALIQAAVLLTKKPWLGLEFGMMAQLFMHGPVGYAAAASATLREALGVVARYSCLRSGVFRLQLDTRRSETDLVLVELVDLGAARMAVLEAVLTVITRLLSTLTGHSCAEVRLHLPWPRPAWAAKYAECFNGVCQFDAERLLLRLPNQLLDRACLTADAQACAQACQDCERQLGPQAPGQPVAERLRARLLRCDGDYPTLAMLAAEQAMSARTLMRRLKLEQTCYQDLLDQVRCERACWYLLHTEVPIDAVAEKLGLHNTSNFSRSFRRWRGTSPARYRAEARALAQAATGNKR